MAVGMCINCKKQREIAESGKTRGFCHYCYKKLLWKPKIVTCKRCGRNRPMHARGLCNGCYNSVYHIESVKMHNAKRYHNVNPEIYKKIIKQCVICGFDKIVELHHLDNNHNNNSETNFVGICPNHHKMLHHREFRIELFKILKEKGYQIPKVYENDEFYKVIKSFKREKQ